MRSVCWCKRLSDRGLQMNWLRFVVGVGEPPWRREGGGRVMKRRRHGGGRQKGKVGARKGRGVGMDEERGIEFPSLSWLAG
jgi:hypothetical protein